MGTQKWGGLAWAGTLLVIVTCLTPVWKNFTTTVVGPFGGIDAMLQAGLLEWSVRHWASPSMWIDAPIFYPVTGALGFMDSLLGQAWLVAPLHLLADLSIATSYNLAFLGSLLFAAIGMACLWLAAGGSRSTAGVAALALVGGPYTLAQLGHLNQLPPPFVLFALAAFLAALRKLETGRSAHVLMWLLSASLIMQAAFGWYGFAYTVVGLLVVLVLWLLGPTRNIGVRSLAFPVFKQSILPALVAIGIVYLLAQPQLQLADRYAGFTRDHHEVTAGSADIQHIFNRGVYRSEPADWVGAGKSGAERYLGRERQVLHPGWIALVLAAVGWWSRKNLDAKNRWAGQALLLLGLVGLILAFGESAGLPGTDKRLPLPFAWLREIVPPFKAFRGVWRFVWLLHIAVAWWAAYGVQYLANVISGKIRRQLIPALCIVVLTFVSIPADVPAVKVPLDGRLLGGVSEFQGPVLSLPAPENEFAEDRTEALWLARALQTGQNVTGGASGWVPPEIVAFRTKLLDCETGRYDVQLLLAEMKEQGIVSAEIALRPQDERRITFWRNALVEFGAERKNPWPQQGYETYLLPQ